MFIKKRLCRKCNRDLSLTIENFSPRKTDKEGFNIYCKDCKNREKREKRLEKRKLSLKGGSTKEAQQQNAVVSVDILIKPLPTEEERDKALDKAKAEIELVKITNNFGNKKEHHGSNTKSTHR